MKRTPLKRRSKSPMAKAKAEAWKIFSLWIRKRDKYTCITCGKKGEGSFMHSGHYISRRHNATMFDEKNCHAQCMNCNLWGYGNMGTYTLKLQKKYGEEIIKELTDKSKGYKQFTLQELKEIATLYKEKLENYEI